MRLICLWALVAVVAGCTGGSKDKPAMSKVTGTVTLDGTPLAAGSIVADPTDKTGLPAQGNIVDGKFQFESTPGAKTVRINSIRKTGQKDEYGSEITEEAIPAKYNADTTLAETVNADGASEWKFELTTK